MNQYITGTMIKRLREERKMTQAQLAEKITVSDKTISKWETGRGYPDITLLEPLAAALGVSVIELFSGQDVVNKNKAHNLLKMKFYVCPICGNVVQSIGDTVVSCCGITLPALEAAEPDANDIACDITRDDDEYYVRIDHGMSKSHYISFIAAVRDDGCEMKKLYPEGAAEARFKICGVRFIYCFCNRDGLYKFPIRKC